MRPSPAKKSHRHHQRAHLVTKMQDERAGGGAGEGAAGVGEGRRLGVYVMSGVGAIVSCRVALRDGGHVLPQPFGSRAAADGVFLFVAGAGVLVQGGNALVSRDGIVKLADFGASKAYRDHTITDCMKVGLRGVCV